jgi:hypothetical protein
MCHLNYLNGKLHIEGAAILPGSTRLGRQYDLEIIYLPGKKETPK